MRWKWFQNQETLHFIEVKAKQWSIPRNQSFAKKTKNKSTQFHSAIRFARFRTIPHVLINNCDFFKMPCCLCGSITVCLFVNKVYVDTIYFRLIYDRIRRSKSSFVYKMHRAKHKQRIQNFDSIFSSSHNFLESTKEDSELLHRTIFCIHKLSQKVRISLRNSTQGPESSLDSQAQ